MDIDDIEFLRSEVGGQVFCEVSLGFFVGRFVEVEDYLMGCWEKAAR